jgi:alpha-mannosidase
VLTLAEARATVLVPVDVPASGLAGFRVEPGASAQDFTPATATTRRLSNGLVDVEVNADGTFDVTGADGTVLRGVGRLVDGGDRGDSYNYGPPAEDVLVDKPTDVVVEVLETGPLRSRALITRTYPWPTALSTDRDVRGAELASTPVETLVEVRAGEPFVRVATSFLNRSGDHRLRWHVPLPEPVAGSASAGQFAVTKRGLTAEGGWGEFPIPTFPASEFVTAGAATVLLDHATEYEVVGDELAITLLRAIGSISVNIHPLRDEPAASEIPAPGAQELGVRVDNRFAILPSATGWQAADAVAQAEAFRNDVLVTRGSAPAGGPLPDDATGVRVEGADVSVSSVRRVPDGTEVRLVAMTDAGSTARVTGPFGTATTVDLLGRPLSTTPFGDGLDLALAPWEIRTVVLR